MIVKLKLLLGGEENIAGKGDNGIWYIFSIFHNVFKRLFQDQQNTGLCGNGFSTFDLVTRFKSLPNDKSYVSSSKLKDFPDNNLKFDENGGRFSKRL